MVFTDNTTTTGNLRGFHIGKSTGNDTFLWNHETAAMMFATTNVERMRITSTGNVGIGTNNPAQKLCVNGDFKLSANSADWDIQAGACLYMRFSTIYGQNASYIQSVDRNTGTQYPLNIGASATTISGNFTVSGGTKSWRIKHPILENKDLIHVCIEAPRADNLYRGRKQLVNGECEVNLDLECNTTGGMTEGTFVLINKNIQVFVNNNETFDKVVGKVVGNKIIVECDNANASFFIDWLVIGERNDSEIINNNTTSSSGSVIVEVDRVAQIQDNMSSSNTSNVF
jgi:hypothetical protein